MTAASEAYRASESRPGIFELEDDGQMQPRWTDALCSALPEEVRAEMADVGAVIRRAYISRMGSGVIGTNLLRLLTILGWCVREIVSLRQQVRENGTKLVHHVNARGAHGR